MDIIFKLHFYHVTPHVTDVHRSVHMHTHTKPFKSICNLHGGLGKKALFRKVTILIKMKIQSSNEQVNKTFRNIG